MIERVGADGFDGTHLRRSGTVVVGFIADWCPFCVRYLPELERLVREGLEVVLADVTDEASPLWETFQVEIVPTVIVFRQGKPAFRVDGVAGVGLGARETAEVRAAARRTLPDDGDGPARNV